ncbi:hypothetical protein [Gordonia sp. (in: high G+C Gram-positive bacteria)]|uniref:hypothetical protein n=1 Tax=Gordonia sp. (in: high G+C Gram-positive bacteria) TaxID=84139 RepID=UPI0039E66A28
MDSRNTPTSRTNSQIAENLANKGMPAAPPIIPPKVLPGVGVSVQAEAQAETTTEVDKKGSSDDSERTGRSTAANGGTDAELLAGHSCEVEVEEPDVPAPKGVLDKPMSDGSGIEQGQHGDCWLVATVVGLQGTEEGRNGLARTVTASPQGGYDVRLYDPDGTERTVHVTKVFSNGSKENGRPGLVSIIEAAVWQREQDRVHCGTPSRGGLEAAQQLLTGKDPEDHGMYPWTNKAADRVTNDHKDINQRIAEGGTVIMSTSSDATFNTRVRVDGKEPTRQVKMVDHHVYTVVESSADGVWVRNPWGPGNRNDDGYTFFVPKGRINDLFKAVSISSPLP